MRVLIVEDNEDLADLLTEGLKTRGLAADRVASAGEAIAAAEKTRYAAIILDLGLPDTDGITVLRTVRNRSDPTPVLILTAKAGVHDRIAGLRAGADDFLAKPFDMEELVARMEALLRRPREWLGGGLKCANLVFDVGSQQLFVDGQPHVLSARESTLLELLLRRKGRVVSKRLLEDHLFGLSTDLGSNAVEVYVHRLRKRLLDVGAQVSIHTLRGIGYLLDEKRTHAPV